MRKKMGGKMDARELRKNNIETMNQARMTADAVRKQNYDAALRRYRSFLVCFQQELNVLLMEENALREEGIVVSSQEIMQMLSDIMTAQEQKDYILLADLLEITVMPFLLSLQEKVAQRIEGSLFPDFFEENCTALLAQNALLAGQMRQAYGTLQYENNREIGEIYAAENGTCYLVEDTKYGYPTIKVIAEENAYYLHSNKNPWEEASLWAGAYEEIDNESFTILGAGFLYHVRALADDFQNAYPVHVYEPDCHVLAIALRYMDLRTALQKYLVLHYDENLTQLALRIAEEPKGFFIHAPSLRNISRQEVRKSFHKFYIADTSMRTQKWALTVNFKKNTSHICGQSKKIGLIDEILSEFKDKDVYIIAAGPSLDKNIEVLKNRTERMLLLATGTVFRKMMGLGIRPDYVLITDPNSRIISQISGQEQETVPMLLLSTVWQEFIPLYAGKKYLIFQKDFPKAEELAGQRACTLFETGGSVSTAALDIAIRGKAARVIFLGLDLAFTGNLAHAAGTANQMASSKEDLFSVKDFYGKEVDTDLKFTIYREWIERRITGPEEMMPEMINATEGGSYIQGMRHLPLKEVIR